MLAKIYFSMFAIICALLIIQDNSVEARLAHQKKSIVYQNGIYLDTSGDAKTGDAASGDKTKAGTTTDPKKKDNTVVIVVVVIILVVLVCCCVGFLCFCGMCAAAAASNNEGYSEGGERDDLVNDEESIQNGNEQPLLA